MTRAIEDNMTGSEIKRRICGLTTDTCGFEVFVVTKNEPRLKKMQFIEEDDCNLRYKLRDTVMGAIKTQYGSDDAEYVSADRVADEQGKIYIVPTSEDYDPFAVLRSTAGVFRKDDVGDATGIAYSIRREDEALWAYQHLWSLMVPNKSKKHRMARIITGESGDVFEELADPIIAFPEKLDVLVVGNSIITSNYKLLESRFGFQDFVKTRANETIRRIREKGLVANVDKLHDYIQRRNGKLKYAKKLMRVSDSSVLKMDSVQLWANIHNSSRWSGIIMEKDGQFVLNTYKQVENLIDLLDERYTRSDITGEEYDTEVKQVAVPVPLP